jgi:SAM-dependent methyltransferase
MDLKEGRILGEGIGEHWYYRSKALALKRLVGPVAKDASVIDVGAGSGFFARELARAGMARSVVCVDTGYESQGDEALADGRTIEFRRSMAADGNADLVLFMDVLEHVDDDVGLVREYLPYLRRGGFVAITVPAFQALWSQHDVFLEHRRRYTLRQVEAVMAQAGLRVLSSHYFFGLVLPVAAAVRVGDRLRREQNAGSALTRHHPVVNAALTRICAAELLCARRNRVGGLSVMALGARR